MTSRTDTLIFVMPPLGFELFVLYIWLRCCCRPLSHTSQQKQYLGLFMSRLIQICMRLEALVRTNLEYTRHHSLWKLQK